MMNDKRFLRTLPQIILYLGLLTILVSCAPTATAVPPTETPQPEITVTATETPTATEVPTATSVPYTYVTLGELFSQACANGNPAQIWSNDAFNGPYKNAFDDHHGHVDIFPPFGCNVNKLSQEVLAPVSGIVQKYDTGGGTYAYTITLPNYTLITGIDKAFAFSGIKNFNASDVNSIDISLAHINAGNTTSVQKNQPFADFIPFKTNTVPQYKVAYIIQVYYNSTEYDFTPTLFSQDGPAWVCVKNSPYNCYPHPNWYPSSK